MALNTDHLYFKGTSNIGDSHITDRLETSLVAWMNWAFLEIGSFYNVEIPTSGAFGGDFSKLRAVRDPAYTNYKVYEAPRQDWVFETGLAYTGGTPISVSGVYVDGTFYGPADATYGHYTDYPRGRIVFNTALTSANVVKANYTYRQVQVHTLGDAPWWKEIQYNSMRVDESTFTQLGSGNWSIGAQHRIQMPSIVVESKSIRTTRPVELGNGSLWIYQDVDFTIFAESKYDRDKLMDIMSSQSEKAIVIFNTDEIEFPLDYRGEKVDNPVMYPDFVKPRNEGGARWQIARFTNTKITEIQAPHPNLYVARVRASMEFPFGNV